jgi:hypothetical protein
VLGSKYCKSRFRLQSREQSRVVIEVQVFASDVSRRSSVPEILNPVLHSPSDGFAMRCRVVRCFGLVSIEAGSGHCDAKLLLSLRFRTEAEN